MDLTNFSGLQKLKSQYEKTKAEFVIVENRPLEADIGLSASKLCGRPYYTSVQDFPKDKQGQDMVPLAQINFEDVPTLDGFPDSGLLQFYLAYDKFFGMNISDLTDNSGFRVKYIPKKEINLDKAIRFEEHKIGFPSDFPVQGVHELTFKKKIGYVTLTDFQCEIDQDAFYDDLSDEEMDYYWEKLAFTSKHKIGGYAHFGQDDPRYGKNGREYSVQLFQLLSTHTGNQKRDIFLGMRGTMHFFMKPEALQNLNFDDVLYTWDVY